LAKARQRRGFGWKRWSSRWLYDGLGLFGEYKVQWKPARKAWSSRWLYDGLGLFGEYKVQWKPARKALSSMIGRITLDTK
jgi:hypothetical protein